MTAIAKHSKDLQVLSFDAFEARPNNIIGMEKFAELEALEKLSFIHSYELSDEVIHLMCSKCNKLQEIELNSTSSITSTYISITKNYFLCFSGCYNITGNGLNAVFSQFSNMKKIAILNLGVHSIIKNDVKSNIQVLKIHGCDVLNEELTKIAMLQNLEELDVQDLNSMPNQVICAILLGCRKLKKVTISGNYPANNFCQQFCISIPSFCRLLGAQR